MGSSPVCCPYVTPMHSLNLSSVSGLSLKLGGHWVSPSREPRSAGSYPHPTQWEMGVRINTTALYPQRDNSEGHPACFLQRSLRGLIQLPAAVTGSCFPPEIPLTPPSVLFPGLGCHLPLESASIHPLPAEFPSLLWCLPHC